IILLRGPMPKIDHFLALAVENKASDLHFSTGEPTRFRVDGDLQIVDETPFDGEVLTGLLCELLTADEQQRLMEKKNLDKSFSSPNIGNFRLNIFFNRKGIAAVLRTIPTRIPTLAELLLPTVCSDLCNLDKGLVLVTGPTGSGKSTTLAAMINHINETSKNHILTVEDPVEFVHESKQSLINQREIGSSCHSFADALKYALREDPDVILIGEMRDLETIALALTAAETGHLVFGTLHTRGAAASIDRIIDSFPSNQQAMIRTMLAESLKAVISQILLKRSSGHGRAAAHEIMVVNNAISNLIREGKTFQIPSAIQVGRKDGMITMDQSLVDLVGRHEVNPEEVIHFMENPNLIEAMIKNMPKSKRAPAPLATPNSPAAVTKKSQEAQNSPSLVKTLNIPNSMSVTSAQPLKNPSPSLKSPTANVTNAPPAPPKIPTPIKGGSTMSQPPPIKSAASNPIPTVPKASPPPSQPASKISLQESFKSLLEEDGSDDLLSDIEFVSEEKKKTG
ncbi:MAG: PilT/PilU family type 4a pilus ATPase, partial [Deltaproteobacteria bacterium]